VGGAVSFFMVVGMLLYLFILQLKLMGIQFIIVLMLRWYLC